MKIQLFFILVIFLLGCVKNISQCDVTKKPTGEFIYNSLYNEYNDNTYVPEEVKNFDMGDTILCDAFIGKVYLHSKDTNCTYEWVINQDTIFSQDVVFFIKPNEKIKVMLKVKSKLECLSESDKIKITTREFIGIDAGTIFNKRYYGKWLGAFNDSINNQFVVEFKKGSGSKIVTFEEINSFSPLNCQTRTLNLQSELDSILNIPQKNDITYLTRKQGNESSLNQIRVVDKRELYFVAINNCRLTKNICSNTPFYVPSIYVLMKNLNEIQIVIVGERNIDNVNPLFKKIYKGRRI
jgi:hypothetical protein